MSLQGSPMSADHTFDPHALNKNKADEHMQQQAQLFAWHKATASLHVAGSLQVLSQPITTKQRKSFALSRLML